MLYTKKISINMYGAKCAHKMVIKLTPNASVSNGFFAIDKLNPHFFLSSQIHSIDGKLEREKTDLAFSFDIQMVKVCEISKSIMGFNLRREKISWK